MAISFGSSSGKSTTNSNSQTDPWDVTIPYLTDFFKEMGAAGGRGLSPDQQAAFGALKANAAEGNPWTAQIAGLANQAFGTADRSGDVGAAFAGLNGVLGDIAGGKYLDPMSNPQMAAMLSQVGDDVQNRINAMFAGAGRDLSGANQGAVAKGVTSAQLPLLLDQYNRERVAQVDAARTIADARTGTARTQAELDAMRMQMQKLGLDLGDKAIAARDYAGNQVVNLDQQIKQLPLQDLGLLASILFPGAGLGAQEQGTSQTKSSSSGFGFSLCDERAKDHIEQIGELANGLPVYRWQYKGQDEWHVGPMAQDVERIMPGAVVEGPDGFKYVDLDMATRPAADMMQGA